jgi:excisionase family DNA binding protein
MLNVRQCAEILAVKESTIRAWLIRRKLPRVNCGRAVRIPAGAVRQDAGGNKVLAEGLSHGQVKAISAAVSQQQKFVGEIVHHAHRWDWDGRTLRIYFSSDKRAFGELLQSRDALLKVQNAVQGILGTEAKIGVQVEQQLAPTPQRTTGSANKVQKWAPPFGRPSTPKR